ncbi:MAG: hypothetical protein Q8904_08185 [Bacteroidota bacterium]|nr:hypothetical protein [Bacteroidota bacterium]
MSRIKNKVFIPFQYIGLLAERIKESVFAVRSNADSYGVPVSVKVELDELQHAGTPGSLQTNREKWKTH